MRARITGSILQVNDCVRGEGPDWLQMNLGLAMWPARIQSLSIKRFAVTKTAVGWTQKQCRCVIFQPCPMIYVKVDLYFFHSFELDIKLD